MVHKNVHECIYVKLLNLKETVLEVPEYMGHEMYILFVCYKTSSQIQCSSRGRKNKEK